MNLFKKITSLDLKEDWIKIFHNLSMDAGWNMLPKSFTDEEKKLVILFCIYSYDPQSPRLKDFKNRIKDKADIAESLGIPIGIAEGLVTNDYEEVNSFVSWYYHEIKETELNAILSGQELIEEQLRITKNVIPKTALADYEKYLKAIQLKNECWINAVENQMRIDQLIKNYNQRFMRTDEAYKNEVADEIRKNSGMAEQQAMKNKLRVK